MFKLRNFGILFKKSFENDSFHKNSLISNIFKRSLTQESDAVPKKPKNSNKKNWRESASLIVLAKDDTLPESEYDYSLLMCKRSAESNFMPSTYVYPGGVVESFDFDASWYDLYAKHGVSRSELDDYFLKSNRKKRIPIVSNSLMLKSMSEQKKDHLIADIGLRIAAIRETFEETGILLLTSPNERNENAMSIEIPNRYEFYDWQFKIRESPEELLLLCEKLGLVPNVWALFEWSNWLTPNQVYQKRYDAVFYACQINHKPPVYLNKREHIHRLWCSPLTLIQEFRSKRIILPPPQLYETSKLINFKSIDEFKKYSFQRQKKGTERWQPFKFFFKNDSSIIFVYPGDFRYPKNPRSIPIDYESELEGTIDDDLNVGPLNRTVIKKGLSKVICNIDLNCGHYRPVQLES